MPCGQECEDVLHGHNAIVVKVSVDGICKPRIEECKNILMIKCAIIVEICTAHTTSHTLNTVCSCTRSGEQHGAAGR